MIKEFIYNFLNGKLQKKKHDVIKLQWEKAKLEAILKQLKDKEIADGYRKKTE